MTAGFGALDDQCVGAVAYQSLRQHQGRSKTDNLRPATPDPPDRSRRRHPTGKNHMPHAVIDAGVDQFVQLGMHGNQVYPERLFGERICRGDFLGEELGRQRPAGDHSKTAGIGNRGDQVVFGNPRHGAAHDRVSAAKELAASTPEPVEPSLGRANRHRSIERQGHRRCAARELPTRYTLLRSGH